MAPTIDEMQQKIKILEAQVARRQDEIEYLRQVLNWYIESRDSTIKQCDEAIKKLTWGI